MAIPSFMEFMSKRSLVEGAIRRAVHEGSLSPGEKLNPDEIAKQLRVSRTPVREAFRQLELEGYLRVAPCVGTVVVGLEPQEIIDIYTIRINLEGLATRLAVPRIDAEHAAALERFLQKIDGLILEKGDYPQIEALNRAFHFGIYERSDNSRLLGIIRSLWDSVIRHRAQISYMPGTEVVSVREHKAILEAIRATDSLRVEHLMQRHLERSSQSLLEHLNASGGKVTAGAFAIAK